MSAARTLRLAPGLTVLILLLAGTASSASPPQEHPRGRVDPAMSTPQDCRWSTRFGPGLPDGPILALFPLPGDTGTLVVGGEFQHVPGTAASNVALWDGTHWSAMGAGRPSSVRFATRLGQDLVVGGDFGVAFWNRWDGWRTVEGVDGTQLRAVAAWGGGIVVAGEGREIDWSSGHYWAALPISFPFPGPVNALLNDAGALIAAGDSRIAVWDASAWRALPEEFPSSGELPGITSLIRYRGNLVVAGSFEWSDSVRYIVEWNDGQWRALGTGVNGPVRRLSVANDRLFAMGDFSRAGGREARYVAAWDGESWNRLLGGTDGPVSTAAPLGDRVYAAGTFTRAGGTLAAGLAFWSDGKWGGVACALDAEVSAFLDCDSMLVAGGYFQRAGGAACGYIAGWDGEGWRPLGDGFDDRIWALARYQERVIAGGAFKASGTEPVHRVAAWDGSRWEPLGEGFDLPVFALLTTGDGSLYAGGAFTKSGDRPVAHIARWNGIGWEPVGGGCDDWITGLTEMNGRVYAGGFFEHAGDSTASRVAEWDGSRWRGIAGEMDRTASVSALAVYRGELVAAGTFERIGDADAHSVGAWDGREWHSLGGQYSYLKASRPLVTLHSVGGLLFVGGQTLAASNGAAGRMLLFDGLWHNIGTLGNMYSIVTAVGHWNGHLFVGGEFESGPCGPSRYIAEWFDLGSRVPVHLLSFTAERRGSGALLRWTLAEDAGPAGFEVFREGAGGERVPVANGVPSGPGSYEAWDPSPTRTETAYWLLESTRTGETAWHGPTILPAGKALPPVMVLEQNAPNPVRASTVLRFSLTAPGPVRLRVYDLAGRVVAMPFDGAAGAGPHELTWNATDDLGRPVARGIYFYRLDGPLGFRVRRLVVLR
jgi:hypothetical protein